LTGQSRFATPERLALVADSFGRDPGLNRGASGQDQGLVEMEPQQRMEHLPEDRDDGGLPPFQEGVGEILRRRRESYGQDLPTVASQLHIRLTYLRAVETGRFKDLPGMAYASGFVRSYGDYLGLDGEELVRLFREEVAGVDRQVRLNVPIVASEGRIPGGAVLLLSGFLAVLAYGVWYYLADRHKSLLDLVPEVPSQLRAILGKEVPTDVATAPPMVKPQSATSSPQEGTAGAVPAQGSAAPVGGTASAGAGAQEAPPAPPTAAGATPSTIASQHATPPAPMASAAAPAEPQAPAASELVEAGDPRAPARGVQHPLATSQPPGPSWPRRRRRRSSWPIRRPGSWWPVWTAGFRSTIRPGRPITRRSCAPAKPSKCRISPGCC
jgi:cytoskeleton protein RodZ